MAEKVNPSPFRPAEAFKTAGAIAYGGQTDEGFIVDSSSPTQLSSQDTGIDETQFNNFAQSSTTSSFDVTIDAGEGFIFGSWIAIDTSTTVTLASSTSGQTVYVGWNKDSSNDVVVGLDGDFSTTAGDNDRKIPLFTFDTDGSGVTSVANERHIGRISNSTGNFVKSNLPSDGKIVVDSTDGMVVAGEYTVDGELLVDGAFTVTGGSLTGTGSISGSGNIRVN